MIGTQSNGRIEFEAARMAIEWKNLFAKELQFAALQLAKDSQVVTAEHLLQALPIATSRVLHTVNKHSAESDNARRRIA
ncbi:MAG: hypothetical protein V3R99_11255 [Thermoguttaceae bacterium]